MVHQGRNDIASSKINDAKESSDPNVNIINSMIQKNIEFENNTVIYLLRYNLCVGLDEKIYN